MSIFGKLIILLNVIFLILFVFGSYFVYDLFRQPSEQITHLTSSNWFVFTIDVQHFNYQNGTVVPTSGIMSYPNVPSILFWVYLMLITNIVIMKFKLWYCA